MFPHFALRHLPDTGQTETKRNERRARGQDSSEGETSSSVKSALGVLAGRKKGAFERGNPWKTMENPKDHGI